jgi:23S rRNA pseudouridine1911/1915/1917 synthase
LAKILPKSPSNSPQPRTVADASGSDQRKQPAYPLNILCEDGPLLAVNKPAGIPTQGVPDVVPSLEAVVKAYLREKYQKPGNVYLGIPHRLDRPVSGVVVFARNSKAAARLAEQFRLRQVRKWYLAVVKGRPDPSEGTLTNWLLKEPDFAKMNDVPEGTPGAKLATLSYRVIEEARSASEEAAVVRGSPDPAHSPTEGLAFNPQGGSGLRRSPPHPNPLPHGGEGARQMHHPDSSLVLIELHTGRMHQIRAQFASRGWPIVGDERYGASKPGVGDAGTSPDSIFLHAARLDLRHPVRYDPISLTAPLPENWRRCGFGNDEALACAAGW